MFPDFSSLFPLEASDLFHSNTNILPPQLLLRFLHGCIFSLSESAFEFQLYQFKLYMVPHPEYPLLSVGESLDTTGYAGLFFVVVWVMPDH